MSAHILDLENFSGPDGPDEAQTPETSPEYISGYEDGRMAALQEVAEDQLALRHALVAAVEDLTFTHTDAKSQILSALSPLFEQLSSQLIPILAQEAFGPYLLEMLASTVEATIEGPLILCCAPQAVLSIEAALERTTTPPVTLRSDPTLEAQQVIVTSPQSEALLDMPALVRALQTALCGLTQNERSQANG